MLRDSPGSDESSPGSVPGDFEPPESGQNQSTGDPRNSVIATVGLAAAKFWPITLAAWLALIGTGIYAFMGGLDREGFPPVDVPIVLVDGLYFADDPEVVDAEVTTPLQEAYSQFDDVKDVTTFALPTGFVIVVELQNGVTSPEGVDLLAPATDQVQLPEGATAEVRSLDAAKFVEVYDVLVSISGPDGATPEQLEVEAETLRAYLEGTDGVIAAETRNLISEALDPATGELVSRETRFSRTFFAGDDSYTSAIVVGLIRDPDDTSIDILGFSARVNERLDSVEAPALSEGYGAAITADFAVDVETQVDSLIRNLVSGLIAVFMVSLLLIGWRASIVTALFMVTVVMAALVGLMVVGYSLNTITLFGLILTLGLLVDDAIVIGESVDTTKIEGGTRERILGVSLTRVALASLAGTLTTVLVFGPLMFVGGILGEFIRAIPVTVIITLLVSYVASVVFIPAVARFLLIPGRPSRSPIIRAERLMADALGKFAEFQSRRSLPSFATGVMMGLLPLAAIFGAGMVASTLGFNIFPASKDANVLQLAVDFPPGATIEEAKSVSSEIDEIVVEVLGEDLLRSQYVRGNERGAETFIDLVPFGDRDTKAPLYVERLEGRFAAVEGARVTVAVLDAGPPVESLPFAVQIDVNQDTIAAGQALAEELVAALPGTELDKPGDPTTISEALISTEGRVSRLNGKRYLEVRAAYDSDDLTSNLTATQELLEELYPPERLDALGLPSTYVNEDKSVDNPEDVDTVLSFDFGQESDSQDDFAGLVTVFYVALALMLVLLILQFRSIVQPLLVFLAIPFGFLGVTLGLALTNNQISFFAAVGFIALIGVVVNNTILLVDSANQARREGLGIGASIGQAVTRRFRPLVATTVTTVAGLVPLALSDPFWEGLAFTLMGGLISSTIIVLLSFPVYYIVATKGADLAKQRFLRLIGRQHLGSEHI